MKEIEIESIKKVGIQTTNPEVRNPFVSNIHFQKTLNQRMTYLWFEHHKLWLLKRHGTSKIISHDLDCLMCCDCHLSFSFFVSHFSFFTLQLHTSFLFTKRAMSFDDFSEPSPYVLECWETEDLLTLEQRRCRYKCGNNFVTLNQIPSWANDPLFSKGLIWDTSHWRNVNNFNFVIRID